MTQAMQLFSIPWVKILVDKAAREKFSIIELPWQFPMRRMLRQMPFSFRIHSSPDRE
jgi:hypothetical protein